MSEASSILKDFENQYVPQINRVLQGLNEDWIDQPILQAAMTYSVTAGGKRLRPLLTLAVLQTYQDQPTSGQLMAASALELLHTYSLIHDDLPAMDNDDLRRGVATNHVKFGAGMATLAGDGLLTLAFEWLSNADVPAEQQLAMIRALSHAAGSVGMVAGQAQDISSEHQQLKIEQLAKLHRQKTGALLHYAVEAGCIMADVKEVERQHLLKFADQFGLAYQIYDDLLDVTSTAEELGKKTHKDAGEEKNTYPGLFGVEGTEQRLRQVVSDAESQLAALNRLTGRDYSLLNAFCSYFRMKE
ncbi:polyprenyl synthetase family protein [Lactobacillus sp. LC28-10]|uniref:Polyprenyl synthetase family protein n=1 Tax=Secundilactobacillus angelensis TaxID=2722706 RepID=A0ABX1L002_9LACO|nr:farnesyl diphosphate synthase [Secundilactobacillus angelensis]MCH5463297.1 polyprenyl synthetase family protein [Secundilactobacillus angelensis]NLR19219.1 polyprenyl synthetase family protein [Secundilactobacillus angelensis]